MRTDADYFQVKCPNCGKMVKVTKVVEFHNVGGFRGYSYSIRCKCGGYSYHDGDDVSKIPENMKVGRS